MAIKLKVINKTDYSTGELKKLALGSLKFCMVERTRFQVEISYGRKPNWVGGWAWYHSGRWKITMPRVWNGTPESLAKDFAQTCVHEIYHCRGVNHVRMPTDVSACTVKVPFAEGAALVRMEKSKVTSQDRVDAREKAAIAHVARLEREVANADKSFKRKRKLQTKWRAKGRDYEKRRENPPPPRPKAEPKPRKPTRFETLTAGLKAEGWDLRRERWWDGYEGGNYLATEVEGIRYRETREFRNLDHVEEFLDRRQESREEAATG